MEAERDKYVQFCPYCGGSEIILAYQDGHGAASAVHNLLGMRALYHSVCRNCGSVVRSFVKEPEKLLKRRDRRQS